MRWRAGICALILLALTTGTHHTTRASRPTRALAPIDTTHHRDPYRASRSRPEGMGVNQVAGSSVAGLSTTSKGGHDGVLLAGAVPAPMPSNSHLNWHALAMCESTDSPRAVSPSGKYRGLYQFDLPTWHEYGGVGDPIDSSRSTQTRVALALFEARGRKPWPVCGRHL